MGRGVLFFLCGADYGPLKKLVVIITTSNETKEDQKPKGK
jgi:hypothetical protein